jgi:thiol-disulfide isomerase/thioredoxin
MVAVNSTMLPLGTPLPPLELPDPTGAVWSAARDAAGAPALVVAFVCNHCPYVRHLGPALGRSAAAWQQAGAAVVAVNANDADAYPDDSPEAMVATALDWGWTFPYLVDGDQSAAHAFAAACTPDFYVFDAAGRLAYRGRFDGSTPGNGVPVTGDELDAAVRAVLAGRPVAADDQVASIGCNIKWRPGNEPAWFG